MAAQYLAEVFKKTDPNFKQIAKQARSLAEQRSFHSFRLHFIQSNIPKKPRKPKSIPTPQPAKPKISQQSRHAQMKQQKQKTKQSKQFIQQMKSRRVHLQKREQKRQQQLLQRLKAQQERQKMRYQQAQKQKAAEKSQKIHLLEQKALERKANLRKARELGDRNYRKVAKSVPLYQTIQDRFNSEIIMPELQKKKADLARKRMMAQQQGLQQLQEHSRKHDQLVSKVRQQNRKAFQSKLLQSRLYLNSVPKSTFRHRILQEEKQKQIDSIKEINYKKQLVDKKKHYSYIVKEMFQPIVDVNKQRELEYLKEKLHHQAKPPRPVQSSNNSQTQSQATIQRRKWKKNPLVPEQKPKKEVVVVDYLAERRKQRDISGPRGANLEWDPELPPEKLHAVAQRIENEAKKQEVKLNYMKTGDTRGLENAEQVTDLFLNSIKAKLAILENSNS